MYNQSNSIATFKALYRGILLVYSGRVILKLQVKFALLDIHDLS